MAVRDIFKVSRKTFFNPAAWIDIDGIVDQTVAIKSVLKNAFTAPAPGVPESFEEVVKRQGLSEKDIKDGAATYKALAIVFFLLGLLAFVYSFYVLIKHGTVLGFLLSLSVTGLLGAQAFRYDFWAMQMQNRKLGMTIKDWKRQYLG
jgi:hypothetical protein